MRLSTILIFLLFASCIMSLSQKQLNQGCLCDISNSCDNQCCCDSSCSSTFISNWKTYNLCFDDAMSIPFCSTIDNASASSDVNVLNLHSGLRMIYEVIKRLFCISKINFVDPTQWYKTSVSDNDLTDQINTASQVSVLNSNLQSLSSFTIVGLPLKSSSGICYSSSKLASNYLLSSSCRSYITASTDIPTNAHLSISSFLTSLSLGSINTLTTSSSTSISATSSTLPTSCTGSACTNVIRQIKLFINSADGSINSNSYLVVGPMTVTQAGYITVKYSYSFVSVASSVTIFPYESDIGYAFGVKLQLLYSDTANSAYYKILNPINLAFRKQDGTCTTASSNPAVNSFIQLKFGQSQVYSCVGSTSLIYTNLKTAFNYIGIYGISSSTLKDFISLNYPTADYSNTLSIQLLVYYSKIGTLLNPQYEILSVAVNGVTSINGLCSLYIEYVSIDNSYSLYAPSPPKVDAYLPNDFLYPFYVA